ncbi:MAG: phosphatidylserine/phosphatidylglycerophosphate/cardiolipin synthase family protein [Burkholderiales bacterium]
MKFSTLHMPQLLSVHGLIVALGLLVYVLTTHVMQQRRAPSAAISWVLTIALIPYLGLPLYLLFGMRKLMHTGNRSFHKIPARSLRSDDAWPRQLAESMGQPPAAAYRNLHIHADGAQALQALWDVIDSAERELVLCTFILGRDPMGKELIKRLTDKAHTGVSIRFLLDGFGSILGGGANLRKLKAAGVQVMLFGPILQAPFKHSANLRNHRKMVVADGTQLWCGGRNFAAEYFEGTRKRAPWRDASFDLQGPLAGQAHELFERDWAYASGLPYPENKHSGHSGHAAQEPFAQLIASGPDQADDTVHDMLVTACFKAHSRILAVTPYFIPGETLSMALSLAARRNVTVDLILPRRSNHHLADYARHRALRGLVAAGGRVWLAPAMLHAKVVVIDDDMALSGTVNLDSRSLFLNYELMVAFYAAADVKRFARFIETHRKTADRYQARKPGLLRDFTEGLVLWLAFQL